MPKKKMTSPSGVSSKIPTKEQMETEKQRMAIEIWERLSTHSKLDEVRDYIRVQDEEIQEGEKPISWVIEAIDSESPGIDNLIKLQAAERVFQAIAFPFELNDRRVNVLSSAYFPAVHGWAFDVISSPGEIFGKSEEIGQNRTALSNALKVAEKVVIEVGEDVEQMLLELEGVDYLLYTERVQIPKWFELNLSKVPAADERREYILGLEEDDYGNSKPRRFVIRHALDFLYGNAEKMLGENPYTILFDDDESTYSDWCAESLQCVHFRTEQRLKRAEERKAQELADRHATQKGKSSSNSEVRQRKAQKSQADRELRANMRGKQGQKPQRGAKNS